MSSVKKHCIVECDESFWFKTKYGRGKRKPSSGWVFVMCERASAVNGFQRSKFLAMFVPRRTKLILHNIITRFILPGTTIVTDEFRSYRGLDLLGYHHETVCHKTSYKSPTGWHTNSVEGINSELKRTYKYENGKARHQVGVFLDRMMFENHSLLFVQDRSSPNLRKKLWETYINQIATTYNPTLKAKDGWESVVPFANGDLPADILANPEEDIPPTDNELCDGVCIDEDDGGDEDDQEWKQENKN
eukprot:TRINITY_DN78_c0_g1_i4.p3 TRINITY_DN78_c0_g1~~TRINITY_DN78_c0_g1_i4.p3  ORF type:complete len:246 (+),score=49.41 TRINITY_DN78_c0_g1_i4:3559-4296(+)